jgi:hypothetical protein
MTPIGVCHGGFGGGSFGGGGGPRGFQGGNMSFQGGGFHQFHIVQAWLVVDFSTAASIILTATVSLIIVSSLITASFLIIASFPIIVFFGLTRSSSASDSHILILTILIALITLTPGTLRDRHEISVSSYGAIRTNCIVPFSVERVGTNIYLCDLLF